MIQMTINGKKHEIDADPDMPLLWVLRDLIGLTGTKFGCGVAACGACSVHVDGKIARSCAIPINSLSNANIVTIEGLSPTANHPVQKAWRAHEVPQCGYCQSGQMMAAAALLAEKPKPSDADIDAAMTNICRCGTYARIRAAIHDAANG